MRTFGGMAILCAALLLEAPRAGAVEITGFSPPEGVWGTVVTVTGSGFTGATRVTFMTLARAGTVAEAAFTVVSDEEIRVTAPPMLNYRSQRGTVITVFTGDAAAVTVPCAGLQDVSTFPKLVRGNVGFRVRDGEVLNSDGGGDVFVIESGGVVYSGGNGGKVFFVEPGGLLRGGGQMVYLQSGATLNTEGIHCMNLVPGYPPACLPRGCFGNALFADGAVGATSCTGRLTPVQDLTFSPRPEGCRPGTGVFDLLPGPRPVCGNGVVELLEQCDDGNIVPDDGCNEACLLEALPPALAPEPVPVPEPVPTDDDPPADADGDAVEDGTDPCPGTPAGFVVDDRGCSRAQFCAGVDLSTWRGAAAICRRADWCGNDLRRPRDCILARTPRRRTSPVCVAR